MSTQNEREELIVFTMQFYGRSREWAIDRLDNPPPMPPRTPPQWLLDYWAKGGTNGTK